jgi:hypothetical protein
MNKAKQDDLSEAKLRKSLAEALFENRNIIFAFVMVLIFAWGGYEVKNYLAIKSERQISDKVYPYVSALEKAYEKATTPKPKAEKATKAKVNKKNKIEEVATEPVQKTKELFVAELKAPADALLNVIKENKGSAAATRAAITLLDYYLEFGLISESEALLDLVNADTGSYKTLNALQAMQKASVLAASNKCSEAINIYDGITKRADVNFLHAEALLRAAACLISEGQLDQATSKLSKIIADYPNTSAESTAKTYQRLLMLKKSKVVN